MPMIMLDLETMGNNSNSAIVAIGAIEFDLNGLGEEFYCEVDLQSSVSAGLQMDAPTVLWWLNQKDDARSIFIDNEIQNNIETALDLFSDFCKSVNVSQVWGNGAMFDNTILGNAYKATGRDIPWAFWNDRCYRTVKNMYPSIKLDRVGIHHNALDDAKSQALDLIKILNNTKGE